MRVLIALLPLIVFYVLESWVNLTVAVVASMVVVIADLALTRWIEGRLSKITLISAPLVLGLGVVTLVADDPVFTLAGPAIGDTVFATLLVGARLLGRNLLVVALEDLGRADDLHPLQLRHFDGLSWRLAGNLALHAAVTVWAMEQPRETWLFVAGPLQMTMIGAQIGLELGWLRWFVQPKVDAADAAEAARDAAGGGHAG